MIKSQATFCRIHWPVEYADYIENKRGWVYSGGRVKQKIKANKIAGKKEWTYLDWIMQDCGYEEEGRRVELKEDKDDD